MLHKLDNSNGAQVVYLCARNDRDGNPRRGWHITIRERGLVTRITFIQDDPYSDIGIAKLREVVDMGMRHPDFAFPVEKVTVKEFESLVYKYVRMNLMPTERNEHRYTMALGYAWGRMDADPNLSMKFTSIDFAQWYATHTANETGPLWEAWHRYPYRNGCELCRNVGHHISESCLI